MARTKTLMRYFFAFLALNAAIAHAQTDSPIEFKGIVVGGPISQLDGGELRWACRPASSKKELIDTRCAGESSTTLGGAKVLAYSATGYNGKLLSVNIVMKSGNYTGVVIGYTEKYGRPTTEQTDQFTTKSGLTLPNSTAHWKFPNGDIYIFQRVSDGHVMSVGLTVKKTEAELKKEAEMPSDARKARAKDL